MQLLSSNEVELKKQLEVYSEKFKGVYETLEKSNSTFKRMDKQLKKSEKERIALKHKASTGELKILQLSKQLKEAMDAEARAVAQREQLERLCRTLREEAKSSI